MSDVIFPTQIPDGTPASDDRILLSDASDSGAAFDAPVSSLPISTATQSALDQKVDKVTGKGLSTEDYSSAEKSKLSGIEAGAEVNEVNEAPINGTEYARKDGTWVAVTGGGGGGQVDSVVAGTNISVNNADPANPVVSLALEDDENFVTDAEKAILANTSGTNTGDQDLYFSHSTVYTEQVTEVSFEKRVQVINFSDDLGVPASRRLDCT